MIPEQSPFVRTWLHTVCLMPGKLFCSVLISWRGFLIKCVELLYIIVDSIHVVLIWLISLFQLRGVGGRCSTPRTWSTPLRSCAPCVGTRSRDITMDFLPVKVVKVRKISITLQVCDPKKKVMMGLELKTLIQKSKFH